MSIEGIFSLIDEPERREKGQEEGDDWGEHVKFIPFHLFPWTIQMLAYTILVGTLASWIWSCHMS